MSSYKLAFTSTVKKDLDKLDSVTKSRIAKKLKYFVDQNDPLVYARQLIHSKIGSYRFRVGHYRIVFDVKDNTLFVLSIKHRKDIYKIRLARDRGQEPNF